MKLTIVATVHFVVEDEPEYLVDAIAEFRDTGSSSGLFEMVPASDHGETQTVELWIGDPWDGEEVESRTQREIREKVRGMLAPRGGNGR